MTAVFEGSFPNFNVAHKVDNVHHLSLMDIVGKEEMRVKRQLLWQADDSFRMWVRPS